MPETLKQTLIRPYLERIAFLHEHTNLITQVQSAVKSVTGENLTPLEAKAFWDLGVRLLIEKGGYKDLALDRSGRWEQFVRLAIAEIEKPVETDENAGVRG